MVNSTGILKKKKSFSLLLPSSAPCLVLRVVALWSSDGSQWKMELQTILPMPTKTKILTLNIYPSLSFGANSNQSLPQGQ